MRSKTITGASKNWGNSRLLKEAGNRPEIKRTNYKCALPKKHENSLIKVSKNSIIDLGRGYGVRIWFGALEAYRARPVDYVARKVTAT